MSGDDDAPPGVPALMEWQVKQREYEVKKARAKALKLRLTCTICGAKAKLNCPCETTQYCSVECQRIDWRDRGHRKACKKIRNERAAEAARAEAEAEAPTPPATPPPETVFYGPAPRSHADEVRARIAAEHEAARARREANPEREPLYGARYGSRCPICYQDWDLNKGHFSLSCCCRLICNSCEDKTRGEPCALCRMPYVDSEGEILARLRRHVNDEVPEALVELGSAYSVGDLGLTKSAKKAAKIWKRAAELGNNVAMTQLGRCYYQGDGVKLDKKKGLKLWRVAASHGAAPAQYNLSVVLHEQSSDTPEEAFHYARLAAEQGLTAAEFDIGISFWKGLGVAVDLDEARRWLERAVAKGHPRARGALADLNLAAHP
jgi:TPR repeat protein